MISYVIFSGIEVRVTGLQLPGSFLKMNVIFPHFPSPDTSARHHDLLLMTEGSLAVTTGSSLSTPG